MKFDQVVKCDSKISLLKFGGTFDKYGINDLKNCQKSCEVRYFFEKCCAKSQFDIKYYKDIHQTTLLSDLEENSSQNFIIEICDLFVL